MFGEKSIQPPPSHSGNIGGELMPDEFGTEPLHGYRGWHVVYAGDGSLALKSLHVPYLWDRQVEAFCHQQAMMFHRARHNGRISPDLFCSCGIYAQLPEHPLTEWDHAKQGKVSASGTIAMWGRIIECERGYKAQHAEIESPIVLEVSCVKGCVETPTRVALPNHPRSAIPAYCSSHIDMGYETVTVQADIWMREVSVKLSDRYDIEVLSWV